MYWMSQRKSDKVIQCRGRGVFRKNKITPLVGDYVVYQADNDKEGYIIGN
jgi:ribosome biogenesis GTPase